MNFFVSRVMPCAVFFLMLTVVNVSAFELKQNRNLTFNLSPAQKSISLNYGASVSVPSGALSGNISQSSFNSSYLNYLEGQISYSRELYKSGNNSGSLRFNVDYSNHYNSGVEVFVVNASYFHSSRISPYWVMSVQADVEDDLVTVPGQDHTKVSALLMLSYEHAGSQISFSASGGHLDYESGMVEDVSSISLSLSTPLHKSLVGRISLVDQAIVDTFDDGFFVQRAFTNQQIGRVSLDYGYSKDVTLSAFFNYTENKGNGFDVGQSQVGIVVRANF